MFGFFRGNGKVETKSTSTFSEALSLLFGGTTTVSGVEVGPETAMRCSPAFACIRIIAETAEQVPLHLYRKLPDGGRERAADHPAAKALRQPNDWTTPAELKLLLGTHLSVHGNAYAWVSRDGDGNPVELIPLDPRRVSVKPDPVSMTPVYTLTLGNGEQRELDRSEVVHIRGPGLDCYRGDSPVTLAKEAIGLSLTLESHCAGLFGRGAKPSGFLKVKGKKDSKILEKVRVVFENFYRGTDNAGRTMLLDDDMDFTQVQLNSVDTQTLEMRRFQVAEISRYWRVPLSLLNDLERVTHSNAEALGQQFLSFCMLPIFRSITDGLALTLLRPEERDEYYFEFLVDDIARADLAARMQAYASAIASGIYNPNEIREMENRGPYAGGEVWTRQVNTAPVNTAADTGSVAA